jgi:hypothetical protein
MVSIRTSSTPETGENNFATGRVREAIVYSIFSNRVFNRDAANDPPVVVPLEKDQGR